LIGTSDWLGALVSHMGRTFFGGVRVNAIIEWVRSWNVPRGGAAWGEVAGGKGAEGAPGEGEGGIGA